MYSVECKCEKRSYYANIGLNELLFRQAPLGYIDSVKTVHVMLNFR